MNIRYVNEDLFIFKDMEDAYEEENFILVQCISSDFQMGAGIAVLFNRKYNCKTLVENQYSKNYWKDKGYALTIKGIPVICLVTKEHYYDKPTYETIKQSLMMLKEICALKGIKSIAMPYIGCGLDGLNWVRMSEIINSIFKDTDIDVVACHKQKTS